MTKTSAPLLWEMGEPPIRLRCEYLENPLGIDTAQPRLSWILSPHRADKRGKAQTAYHLLVASSEEGLRRDEGDLWDSGRVDSAQSTQVIYGGTPLSPLLLCHWKVQIWDEDGKPSGWATPARWRMGLLRPEDWGAQWITFPAPDAPAGSCPWFRKSFELEAVPDMAVVCVSSIGYHELYINGEKVGDQVLTPSVSDLRQRSLYLTHDVRSHLKPGRNVIAIWLGVGWADFFEGTSDDDPRYAKRPQGMARLDFGQGLPPIVTDATWRCSLSDTSHLGRWTNSDFGGDRVDATLSCPDWNRADFDENHWLQAKVVQRPNWKLSSDLIEPNRMCETIAAIEVSRIAPGKYRFVMARLFTGWVEVKLKGRPGTQVNIHVSSLADREIDCNQCNQYVIGASGEGVFRNRFSYHEFAFVTIKGLDEEPALSDVVGYRVTNDRERRGDFDCSNPLLKRIYDITLNTYENLSTSGMTVDCPHRERLGYGGDGHVSLEIAVDAFASASFLTKWAQDWCDMQADDGTITHTAPTLGGGGGPGWAGFVVTLPWEIYLSYGDERILEKTWPHARRWLDYLTRHMGADHLLAPLPCSPSAHLDDPAWMFLGDWVAPGRMEWSGTPEALLFNNCYYLYVLRLAARMANILGHTDDEPRLLAQADKLGRAINDRFRDPITNVYLDRKQTHAVMPLLAGAVPTESIEAVESNLEKEIVTECQGHLDTGMHGTYFMTKVLMERDRNDLIFTYASQTTYPSYGDLIAKGYDTWPELWEGADSRLHGCLNGIGGWFQRGLAGIRVDPSAPGYKRIIIKPALVGDLTWVSAHHDSPYGRVVSNWKRNGNAFTLKISVPPNTTAIVHVPGQNAEAVLESKRPAANSDGVKFLEKITTALVYEVVSGNYVFEGILC